MHFSNKPLIFFTFILILIAVIQACKHDPEEVITPGPGNGTENCDTSGITYPGTVYPIFEQYCISCHAPPVPEGGIDLTDFNKVAELAQNGRLLGALNHKSGFVAMPPSGTKLDSCLIHQITTWVNDTVFEDPNTGIPCDPDTIYFENDILPLLQSSCGTTGCHDPITAEDDVILTNYADIMATGKIVPGDAQESELYEVITESDPDKIMPPPPNNSLNASQIELIYTWIQQGALNNYCEQEDCDTVNVTFSSTVLPIIQNSCTGCHSGANPDGGIRLENYSDIVAVASSGSLIGVITHAAGYSPMPKNGSKLSDCKIAQIQKWIEDGTPEN